MTTNTSDQLRLRELLAHDSVEVRMKAAMAAGTRPNPAFVDELIDRCGIEPNFFVRDTLTWALLMHPASLTVPRLAAELGRDVDQARSQALHTLSKIGQQDTWRLITLAMLHDEDDQVARTAWRAASVLVPASGTKALARELALELGRGDIHLQRSLSRSLAALGEVIIPVLDAVEAGPDHAKAAHANATRRLLADPDLDFELATIVAKSVVAQSDSTVHRGPSGSSDQA